MTYLALILIGILVFVLSLSMAFDWLPILTENIRMLFGTILSTISGLYLLINGIWKAAPDPAKELVAKILRQIPNLPNYYKRRTVGFEIESEINTALKEFSKEGAGFVEEEVVVKWLTPGEEARSIFFKGGKAYIKLDFAEDKERNIVEAVLLYCSECLLPETRQYIPRPLMRAIDINFIDELLEKRNAVRGRIYFTQKVIPRELEITPEINKYLDTLELLSQHGLFIRILLPELKDYPGRAPRKLTRRSHLEQIESFIDYLKTIAEDRKKAKKRAWLHIGETIRLGIVPVGITDRLHYEGNKPYVRRTAMHNNDGARNVYLVGYNVGIYYVSGIAREAKQRGIVDKYEIMEYDALIDGELDKNVVARMSIPEGAGKEFLRKYPRVEDWPDLEEDDTTISSEKSDAPVSASPPEDASSQDEKKDNSAEQWEFTVDSAWLKRANTSGQSINGPIAANDVIKILGVNRLNESPYKSLKDILLASKFLYERWVYKDNIIIRR